MQTLLVFSLRLEIDQISVFRYLLSSISEQASFQCLIVLYVILFEFFCFFLLLSNFLTGSAPVLGRGKRSPDIPYFHCAKSMTCSSSHDKPPPWLGSVWGRWRYQMPWSLDCWSTCLLLTLSFAQPIFGKLCLLQSVFIYILMFLLNIYGQVRLVVLLKLFRREDNNQRT